MHKTKMLKAVCLLAAMAFGQKDSLKTTLLNETVVTATRTTEKQFLSGQTISKLKSSEILSLNTGELLSDLKRLPGIDVSRTSYFITSPGTRGFGSSKSERVLQLADNVDFISPTSSLYGGNWMGLNILDIESIEILHGANSAIYGSGAFNGVIAQISKSPFEHQGIQTLFKVGNRQYLDGQFYAAKAFGKHFAFKITGNATTANEFLANSTAAIKPKTEGGLNGSDPANNAYGNVNGWNKVNYFGDAGITAHGTRYYMPGYAEEDLILKTGKNVKAEHFRFNPSIYLKINESLTLKTEYRYSLGSGIFQSTSRFAWRDMKYDLFNVELKAQTWIIRAYRMKDFGGKAYEIGGIGTAMQNAIAENGNTYLRNYPSAVDKTNAQIVVGSPKFIEIQEAIANNIGDFKLNGANYKGAAFANSAQFYDVFAQKTIDKDAFKTIFGASSRKHFLTSKGTLISDGEKTPLGIDKRAGISNIEAAIFSVAEYRFNKLKTTMAGRIDHFQNFGTHFSPRISFVLNPAEKHAIRLNVAKAIRQPAQLDQFIYLDYGSLLLIGNVNNGFEGFSDAARKTPISIAPLKVEKLLSGEIGYKTLLGSRLSIDASYYANRYNDFIGTLRFYGREDGLKTTDADFAKPATDRTRGRFVQTWLNYDKQVFSQGFLISIEGNFQKLLPYFNYNYSSINSVEGLIAGFNTPKHKFNLGTSAKISKNLSANANYRWTSTYTYFMPFDEGQIEAFGSLDAQINLKIDKIKSTVQLSGQNLLNANAIYAYGSGVISRTASVGLLSSF